jgi:hypothetical protein
MPAKLRIANFEGRTGIVSEGIRCGYPRCGKVLGDLVAFRGDLYVSLSEGFRKAKNGIYTLHLHAQLRYMRGQPTEDAHGRWTGVLPSGRWGLGGTSLPSNSPFIPEIARERQRTRERVRLAQFQVKCPKCGFVSSST